MAKKSKEIELGGLRIQVDPLVLARRILTRQKALLAAFAVVGGLLTVAVYLRTPRKYTSSAEILVRAEAFQEDYLRKLLNVVARYLGSDTEMMLIINELDLYPRIRATLPYDLALRDMRRELKIDRPGSSIVISFQSRSPREAQRVVAFVTERMMTKLADLKDSPYRQQLAAIATGLDEVDPRLKAAQLRLFEFKAKHPEIAVRSPTALELGSPMAALRDEVARAERDLRRCFDGGMEASSPTRRRGGPRCQRLTEVEAERDAMLAQYTPSHPSVVAVEARLRDLAAQCDREREAQGGAAEGSPATTSRSDCVAAARGHLAALSAERLELERGVSKQPALERRWAELNLEASALDTEYGAYRETYRRIHKERLLAANEFRDSFVLVDPPRVPELPSFPARDQFIGVGAVLTVMLGIGGAALREALRQTFADAREVEEQTELPVLASLPALPEARG